MMAGCEDTDTSEIPTAFVISGYVQRYGASSVTRRLARAAPARYVDHPRYDRKIRRVRDLPCGDTRIYLALEISRVRCTWCDTVKQERLEWLAAHPFYTRRVAFFVGRRCRSTTIKEVAEATRLDGKTIKDLEAQYMCEQV